MSDFRTKLLVVAAMAVATAGASYGQVACGGGFTNNFNNVQNPTLRIEGETELAGDVGIQGVAANPAAVPPAAATWCTNTAAPIANASITANVSLPVTSKLIAAPSTTEATLFLTDCSTGVCGGVGDLATQVIQGTVADGATTGSVTFSGVTLPAAFNFRIANIRVNASLGTPGAEVTETVVISYVSGAGAISNVPAFGSSALQIGLIQPTLSFTTLTTPAGKVSPPNNFVNYATCTGNPISASASAPTVTFATNGSFQVNLTELISQAFKTPATPGVAYSGENGSYVNVGTGVGVATSGDIINIALSNIPTSAVVYAQLNVVSANGTTLTLSGSFPATTPVAIGTYLTGGGLVAFTPTSTGTLNIPYAVTVSANGNNQQFAIPVFVTFGKAAAPVQGAMTVAVSYAPDSTITGPAGVIPTFAVPPAAPVPAETVVACQTTLLFPYVTNYQGTYETGIAIANTTTDNLTAPNTANPTPGTCTLNFYGNAAQPKAVTYPPTGMMGAFSASAPAQNPYYADTLSDLIGAATTINGGTGFTGYAIASCNFNDAHGFAFITDNNPGNSAFAQGYLAVVIPNNRSGQSDAAAGGGNGE